MPTSPQAEAEVPDGFVPIVFRSAFTHTVNARYYVKGRGRSRTFGVRIEPQHCHARGYAHGGFLLALADFTLSYGAYDGTDLPPRMTLHLNADFMRPTSVGDWLEIDVEVRKYSDTLAFADCVMHVGQREILRASGVFRPMRTPDANSIKD